MQDLESKGYQFQQLVDDVLVPKLFPEDDLSCSLCLKYLCDPVCIPCGHTFCKFCLERAVKEKAVCPICRSNISFLHAKNLRPNPIMVNVLEKLYGDVYRNRKLEVEQDRKDYQENEVDTVNFVVGNKYHCVGERLEGVRMQAIHEWTLFLRMEDDRENILNYIEKVEFIIHPSFKDSIILQERPPFRITRIGWGYFDARVVLHFRREYSKPSLTVIHQLVFQDDGGLQVIDTDFSKHIKEEIESISPEPTIETEPVVIDLDEDSSHDEDNDNCDEEDDSSDEEDDSSDEEDDSSDEDDGEEEEYFSDQESDEEDEEEIVNNYSCQDYDKADQGNNLQIEIGEEEGDDDEDTQSQEIDLNEI